MASEQPIPVLLLAGQLGQGGSERQLTETAKALDRSRFAVHVGCFRPEGFRRAELAAQGIPILHLPVHSFKSFSAMRGAWKLIRYLRRNRIRLVHTFDTPTNCFAAPVARVFGSGVVISSQRASRLLSTSVEQRVMRITDHLVDAIVVNCEAMKRHMIEDEGARPDQLRICYNGLDTGHFHSQPRNRPAVLADASIVIGVVCALRREKGLPTLIEAFSRIATVRPGLRLAVVGSGPMLETLRELSAKLDVKDKCHFEPSTPDVAQWMRAIDVFVLPSLSEALSNSLMEAMACGCAVVASKVGGNPELVSDGATGLLFKAGDAVDLAERLKLLILDDELRTRLSGAAAVQIRERFSLEKASRRMEEIYRELLDRK